MCALCTRTKNVCGIIYNKICNDIIINENSPLSFDIQRINSDSVNHKNDQEKLMRLKRE